MDSLGAFLQPPILDGINYVYWKVRLSTFIRYNNERVWIVIVKGWTVPIPLNDDPLDQSEWSIIDIVESRLNQCALNAIYAIVSKDIFTLISTCESAKEAWNILQNTFEGTSQVRRRRLQQSTFKFEALKMEEDETIGEFYTKLLTISNECFALGEKPSEEKLVRKVMRSLPKRFDYKATAIDEAKELSTMKLDELIGSLRTFEMGLQEKAINDQKRIANPKSHALYPHYNKIWL